MKSDNIVLLLTYFTNAGGTERATINLANNFAKQGKKVRIISAHTHAGDLPFFTLDPAVSVEHLNIPIYKKLLQRVFWGIPRLFFRLRKQMLRGDNMVISTTPILISLLLFSIF